MMSAELVGPFRMSPHEQMTFVDILVKTPTKASNASRVMIDSFESWTAWERCANANYRSTWPSIHTLAPIYVPLQHKVMAISSSHRLAFRRVTGENGLYRLWSCPFYGDYNNAGLTMFHDKRTTVKTRKTPDTVYDVACSLMAHWSQPTSSLSVFSRMFTGSFMAIPGATILLSQNAIPAHSLSSSYMAIETSNRPGS